MTLKKTLIIFIVLLIVVGGIFLVYNFLFSSKTTSPLSQNEPSFPLKETRKVIKISTEPVLGVTFDQQKIKYYQKNNGYVFEVDFDGQEKTRISSTVLENLIRVNWSPNHTQVITVFTDGPLIKKYLYDYQTKKATKLDQNIRDFDWAPQENKIAYQYYNPQNQTNVISIANPDGSHWQNILETRLKNLIVKWPSPDKVSIQTRPSGLAQSVLYTINTSTKELKKILNNLYGLTALWSPYGDKLLFSETNSQGKNLKLKLLDLKKETITELDFTTLPEKCVWSQDNRTIFCAVPRNLNSNFVLPDDYYKGKVILKDDFWRINLDTQEREKILESNEDQSYDARNLLLSPQEDYLIFINQKDGLLYSVAI